LAVTALCCLACGAGIRDGRGPIEVTGTVDRNGGTIVLGQASLVMGPGSLDVPTQVTLRRLPSVEHIGAYGPVFEIVIPSPDVFVNDPTLVLHVPNIGANQRSLSLGYLDPTLTLDLQQWIAINGCSLDSTQSILSGPVQGFKTTTVLRFGAVVKCPPVAGCPHGQACNSGACQQCPTGATCP
jgi:hypothetical protein